MIRARLSPLPYLALVALLALAPLGCGGGAGGGVAMQTAATGEALSFAFTPVEPMRFSVDFSSESEFHGTAYIASIRYSWSARDWKQEGEAWTCDVTFSDIKAAMRSGSGIGMEPIEGFDQLEGFTTRYRKDGKGFEPVLEPARDDEFMGMFRQLQAGLAPVDFKTPPSPVSVGQSWQETANDGSLGQLRTVMQDSVTTVRYLRDETFAGRDCARLGFEGKIPLDGELTADQGPMAGSRARVSGKIESQGDNLYDKARGFMLSVEGKSKVIINQRELDERGKPKGAEQSLVQNLSFKIKYTGD